MITKTQKNKLRMYLKDSEVKKTYEYHDKYCDRQIFSNGITLFMVQDFIKGEGIEIDHDDNFCRHIRHIFEKASDAFQSVDPALGTTHAFKLKDLKMAKRNAKIAIKNKHCDDYIEYRDPYCGIVRIYDSKDIMVDFEFRFCENDVCHRWINLNYLIEAMEILNYKLIKMCVYKVKDTVVKSSDYYNDGYSLISFIINLDGCWNIDIWNDRLACIIPALCY